MKKLLTICLVLAGLGAQAQTVETESKVTTETLNTRNNITVGNPKVELDFDAKDGKHVLSTEMFTKDANAAFIPKEIRFEFMDGVEIKSITYDGSSWGFDKNTNTYRQRTAHVMDAELIKNLREGLLTRMDFSGTEKKSGEARMIKIQVGADDSNDLRAEFQRFWEQVQH